MIMRSPVAAMLWESWRLTRAEAARRLLLGIVLTAVVLAAAAASRASGPDAARLALGLLVMTCSPLSLSIAKLNGGRFMDGYRPGYPFRFLYTRPVPTFALVGAPLATLVVSAVAVYMVAALVLRSTFGYPFPLLPLVAWLAAFHIAQWAVQWGTSHKGVQWVGSTTIGLGFTALGVWRVRDWPAEFDVTMGDYFLLAAIGAASFALTIAGVARQRCGDARTAAPRPATPNGFSDRLAELFHFPCPTTSATRAQVWFDVKSSGLPVLVIGLAFAILIPLSFEVTTRLDVVLSRFVDQPATRVVAVVVAMFSLPAVLILGGNAFGINAGHGRTFARATDATQPYGTARMAGLKVLVRSVCLLAALAAVGTSIWTSASLIPFDVLADNDTFIEKSRSPVSGWMRAIEGVVGAMSAYELLALAFVTAIAMAVMVAGRAALPALRARYPRRVTIAGSLLLLYGLGFVLRAPAGHGGEGLDVLLIDTLFGAAPWMTVVGIALVTASLVWRVLAEHLLTLRQALLAVLISAAFGAAWVTVLRAGGLRFSEMPAPDAVWMLSPVVLPLTASVLAPWSLSRVRHT